MGQNLKIVVEGKTDIPLIIELFPDLQLEKADFVVLDGKSISDFHNQKSLMIQNSQEGFNIIIIDIDDDQETQRRKEIADELQGLPFGVVFIRRNLEELLSSTVQNKWSEFSQCWESLKGCVSGIDELNANNLISKDQFYVFMMLMLNANEANSKDKFLNVTNSNFKYSKFFDLTHESVVDLKNEILNLLEGR